MTAHVVTNDQLTAEASSGRLASFCERRHVILLIAIMVIGAAARIQGLSNGTLYRDDAWVALANHYSISTASHMVVTTPGFTFFERFWIGLAPQTTWFDQLPSLLASVTAIWAIFALTRYFRFSAWISLTCALVLTVSNEATIYATHIKPYAFDLLTACLLLWLGERARRALTLRHLGALAIAGIACTAWSFTNAVIVGGIFITLFAISLHRRQAIGAVVATGGIAAIGRV